MADKPRFRFLQFGLRTLLVFALIVCVWLAYHVWRHNAEQSAARKISAAGRTVGVYWRSPFFIDWATPYIGDTIFARVEAVDFYDDDISDEELLNLPWAEFQSIELIVLGCASASDNADKELSLLKRDLVIKRIIYEPPLEDTNTPGNPPNVYY